MSTPRTTFDQIKLNHSSPVRSISSPIGLSCVPLSCINFRGCIDWYLRVWKCFDIYCPVYLNSCSCCKSLSLIYKFDASQTRARKTAIWFIRHHDHHHHHPYLSIHRIGYLLLMFVRYSLDEIRTNALVLVFSNPTLALPIERLTMRCERVSNRLMCIMSIYRVPPWL